MIYFSEIHSSQFSDFLSFRLRNNFLLGNVEQLLRSLLLLFYLFRLILSASRRGRAMAGVWAMCPWPAPSAPSTPGLNGDAGSAPGTPGQAFGSG